MRRAPAMLSAVAVAVDRTSAKPLYQQICEAYRAAIAERRLVAGQRLPSTRALARELRISRIPVLQAFDQLLAEGYFESRHGSGTFVSSTLAGGAPDGTVARAGRSTPAVRSKRNAADSRAKRTAAKTRSIAELPAALLRSTHEPWLDGFGAFRMSEPALDCFPFAHWSRLVARHSRRMPPEALNYASVMGHAPLREALATHLRMSRGMACEPGQIMVVSGSQQALAITARVLLESGHPVWVEEPGYRGARDALAQAGATLVPVPVDRDGLDVAAGVRLCRRARAAYVTPSHQYPLGATLSASRRLQLLDWARESGAWIIEDDYDSEYRYESQPITALHGIDREARVIYVGTFSKVLFPALRVGYLVVPPDLVHRFAAVREAMDICPPVLSSAVLADFIADGHFARHLRRTSLLYRERRATLVDALRASLPQLEITGAEAGMHLVALCETCPDRAVAESAARAGLRAMPLSSCYLGKPHRRGFVLGYGGVAASGMETAVSKLRDVVARSTDDARRRTRAGDHAVRTEA